MSVIVRVIFLVPSNAGIIFIINLRVSKKTFPVGSFPNLTLQYTSHIAPGLKFSTQIAQTPGQVLVVFKA